MQCCVEPLSERRGTSAGSQLIGVGLVFRELSEYRVARIVLWNAGQADAAPATRTVNLTRGNVVGVCGVPSGSPGRSVGE